MQAWYYISVTLSIILNILISTLSFILPDQEVLLNSNVNITFNISTHNNPILSFKRLGSNRRGTLFTNYYGLDVAYKNSYYTINNSDSELTFSINSVRHQDAGVYYYYEDLDHGILERIELKLVVIEQAICCPAFTSHTKDDINPIILHCRFHYINERKQYICLDSDKNNVSIYDYISMNNIDDTYNNIFKIKYNNIVSQCLVLLDNSNNYNCLSLKIQYYLLSLSHLLTKIDNHVSHSLTKIDNHISRSLAKVDDHLLSLLTKIDHHVSNSLTKTENYLSNKSSIIHSYNVLLILIFLYSLLY